MPRIATSHPGKMGDALYALQITRVLCELNNCTADFYTSEHCAPLKNLFEYQPYIENLYIPQDYKISGMGCGIQPFTMPINPNNYERVFQLGFRETPNTDLPSYIARYAGVTWDREIKYDYPDMVVDENYIVVAPRGRTTFFNTFKNFMDKSPIKCAVVGGKEDYIPEFSSGVNFTGLDFLDTVALISKSIGFVGLMSSQLVLANGFDIPKVVIHDGKSWDMRHVLYTKSHFYLANPSTEEIIRRLQ